MMKLLKKEDQQDNKKKFLIPYFQIVTKYKYKKKKSYIKDSFFV